MESAALYHKFKSVAFPFQNSESHEPNNPIKLSVLLINHSPFLKGTLREYETPINKLSDPHGTLREYESNIELRQVLFCINLVANTVSVLVTVNSRTT